MSNIVSRLTLNFEYLGTVRDRGPLIRNGIRGVKWLRDRWRHVTPKGQTHDSQYAYSAISGSWRCYWATVSNDIGYCDVVPSAILATAWLLVFFIQIAYRVPPQFIGSSISLSENGCHHSQTQLISYNYAWNAGKSHSHTVWCGAMDVWRYERIMPSPIVHSSIIHYFNIRRTYFEWCRCNTVNHRLCRCAHRSVSNIIPCTN